MGPIDYELIMTGAVVCVVKPALHRPMVHHMVRHHMAIRRLVRVLGRPVSTVGLAMAVEEGFGAELLLVASLATCSAPLHPASAIITRIPIRLMVGALQDMDRRPGDPQDGVAAMVQGAVEAAALLAQGQLLVITHAG